MHKQRPLSSIFDVEIGSAGSSPRVCGRIAYHSAYRNSQSQWLLICLGLILRDCLFLFLPYLYIAVLII